MLSHLSFPLSGPFTLQRGAIIKSRLFAVLIGFFFSLTAVIGCALVVVEFVEIQQMIKTWEAGVRPNEGMTFNGTVSEDNSSARSWDLDVAFALDDGTLVEFDGSFDRFWGGPDDDDDDFYVHYLPEDPSSAVLSWQYESRHHAWAGWVGHVFIVLLVLVASVFVPYKYLAPQRRMQFLAAEGEVTYIPVFEAKPRENGSGMVVLTLLTLKGRELELSFVQGVSGPHFSDDETEVLALYHAETDDLILLRDDGYPLEL